MSFLNYSSMLPFIIDLCLVILLIISIIVMARKGLVKAIYKIASIVVTILLVTLLTSPITQVLEESQLGANIYKNFNSQLTETNLNGVGISAESIWNMPDFIRNSETMSNLANQPVASMSHTLTHLVVQLIACTGLFILIRLVLALLFMITESLFKLPGLRTVNALAGIIAAILSFTVTVYAVCGIISLDIPQFNGIKEVISQTQLLKMFYNNNLLINIFMRRG